MKSTKLSAEKTLQLIEFTLSKLPVLSERGREAASATVSQAFDTALELEASLQEMEAEKTRLEAALAQSAAAEGSLQERTATLEARLSEAEEAAAAQLAASNAQMAKMEQAANAAAEEAAKTSDQRVSATRAAMLADFERQRAEERAATAQAEGSSIAKAEARLAFAEATAAAAGTGQAAIQSQLEKSQTELLEANRLLARLKEQCEAWAAENAEQRAASQRKIRSLQSGLVGASVRMLMGKSLRGTFLAWKRCWRLLETQETVGAKMALMHAERRRFKGVNAAFLVWRKAWAESNALHVRMTVSVRRWQWNRTLSSWRRWRLFLRLRGESASPRRKGSPVKQDASAIGAMVDQRLTTRALTLEQQLAEETHRATLGLQIAEVERQAREKVEVERDGTVSVAVERAEEAERQLAIERARAARELGAARDALHEQLKHVTETSDKEIAEAHAAARRAKTNAERRAAAAEKEAADATAAMKEAQAALGKRGGAGDPVKMRKELQRARNDVVRYREQLGAAEQDIAALTQRNAALEKRMKNHQFLTSATPRQRLTRNAGSAGATRSKAGSGRKSLSPPPTELLRVSHKTSDWSKAKDTGRLPSTERASRSSSKMSSRGTAPDEDQSLRKR